MRHAHRLPAACAAVLIAVPVAGTARAAPTWTVRPGGGTALASANLMLRDAKTGATITCSSARLTGSFRHGSGLSGAALGSLATATFTHCTSPVGLTFTLTAGALPWRLNFGSYDAGTGTAKGSFRGVKIGVSSAVNCSAVIDGTGGGTVGFGYADGTGTLTTLPAPGNLRLSDVLHCFGLYHDGDPVTETATFAVSPKQQISSP